MGLHGLIRRSLSWIFVAPLLGAAGRVEAAAWPFDQRHILLAKEAAREFPDQVTVAQLLDIFVKRGRVRWVLQKGGRGQVLPVEIPEDFQWQAAPSIKRLGLRYKVDGIVVLRQKGTETELRWYSVADGEPLFFEKVNLPAAGPRAGEEEMRRKRLTDWLDDIWMRIPGRGYVVKRDITTLGFEGAAQTGVKVGDHLELRRLETAERHPLLKTLIGIRSTVSGLATVTDIGDPFSSAKIDYESNIDPIQEGDRYEVKIVEEKKAAPPVAGAGIPAVKTPDGRIVIPLEGSPAAERAAKAEAGAGGEGSEAAKAAEEEPGSWWGFGDSGAHPRVAEVQTPRFRIVDVSARLGWASYTHVDNTDEPETYKISGTGPAMDVNARVFVTHHWIVDANFDYQHFGTGAFVGSAGTSSLGASIYYFRLGAGYRFLFLEDLDMPGEFDVGFGYSNYSFSITASGDPAAPQSKIYSGLDFGIQLKVPVQGNFLVFASGVHSMGASISESPKSSGVATGPGLWNYEGGLGYRVGQDSFVALGMNVTSASASFTAGDGDNQREIPSIGQDLSATTYFTSYTQKF